MKSRAPLNDCPGCDEGKAPIFRGNVLVWNEEDLCSHLGLGINLSPVIHFFI